MSENKTITTTKHMVHSSHKYIESDNNFDKIPLLKKPQRTYFVYVRKISVILSPCVCEIF